MASTLKVPSRPKTALYLSPLLSRQAIFRAIRGGSSETGKSMLPTARLHIRPGVFLPNSG